MKIIFSIIFSTIVVFGTSQDTLSLKEVYIKLQNRLPDPDTINDHIKESAKIIGLTDSLFICKSLTYEDFKSNDPEDAKLVSRIHSIGLDSDLLKILIQGDLNLTNSGIKHTYSKIQNLFSKVSIKIDSDPEYSKLWEQMEQDSSTKIFEDLKSLNYRRFRKKNKMDDVEFGQFMCMSYLSISTTQQLIEANDRLKQLMSPNN